MDRTALNLLGQFISLFTVFESVAPSFLLSLGSGLAYNPYPNYNYSGKLRPFPISETREVPSHISRPDYAETGIPKSEYDTRRSGNVIKPLLSETIAKMRTVCKVNVFSKKKFIHLVYFISWVEKFWKKQSVLFVLV